MSHRLVSVVAKRAAYGLGGTALLGGTAVTTYTFTDQGLGLRREIRFWSKVAPVVFDYWWHVSSSSPLVKFQEGYFRDDDELEEAKTEPMGEVKDTEVKKNSIFERNDDDGFEYKNDRERAVYKKLHDRNAPKIYSIMLELGGLYIKLGQVLSITALPVPSEYRKLFRTLQSSVPGHEEFENVIKPTLEAELGRPLEEIFESIEEIPCGAASIGQAHKAKLLKVRDDAKDDSSKSNESKESSTQDVIIKVQYPDAKWQVPADVHCVGDFLKLCVYFKVVDESSAKLSYEEFSRQFLAELDYLRETRNLKEVYDSTLDPKAPYMQRGVEVPKVFPELCTNQVITMSYIPGPKFEEEAREQLEALGINTGRGIHSVVRDDEQQPAESGSYAVGDKPGNSRSNGLAIGQPQSSWIMKFAERLGSVVGVDNILYVLRLARQALLWSTVVAVRTIQFAPSVIPISSTWLEWAKTHENAASQAEMLEWTSDAIDALFDVHGYQIFNQGLFNADAHPGNILIIQNNNDSKDTKYRRRLGLIDYGQCKRLTPEERQKVARLILSVANEKSDEEIATICRDLGFVTKNDSTKFLSSFARLMFGKFKIEHLDRSWHQAQHEEDQILYFPNELSMVYRAATLLRGLAMSFQLNVSVGEKWRKHAEDALARERVPNMSAYVTVEPLQEAPDCSFDASVIR